MVDIIPNSELNESQARALKELKQKEMYLDEIINILHKKINHMEELNMQLKNLEQKQDDFISIAAHELRSPIQPILGFAELAHSGDMGQEEAWQGVIDMAHKLQGLMGVILDANKIDRDSLTISKSLVDVKEIISRCVTISKYSTDCDVPIIINLRKNFQILADSVRLSQVFQNILNNAIKFTKKGFIQITGVFDENQNELILRFEDTGSGIPHEILPKIFEKFVTKNPENKKPGIGLGLFVCKGIIEAHGGKIHANDNEYGGTTFTIKLPIKSEKIIKQRFQMTITPS